ncbi:hypothetical protein LSAT2_024099 [Lamellibrachia satsuma]|nr:hypothetical protein LSAT2_024099 [Lamellibrachia satsuma]
MERENPRPSASLPVFVRNTRNAIAFPLGQTLSRWGSIIPNTTDKYGIKRSETKAKTPSKSASDKDEWLAVAAVRYAAAAAAAAAAPMGTGVRLSLEAQGRIGDKFH